VTLLGLMAVGAAAPAPRTPAAAKAGGGLTVWVESLPAGLRPRVRVAGPGGPRTVTGRKTTLSLRPGVYTVVAEPVPGTRRSFYPRHDRVRVRVQDGAIAVALVDYATIVPSTTKVLSAALARRLRAASRNELVFRDTQALGLVPRDVLIGGPTRILREGVLVRVVSVRVRGGRTIVHTAPATLTDALPRATIDVRAEGNGRVRSGAAGRASEHETFHLPGIHLPINGTLVQRTGGADPCTTQGGVTLNGGLFVDPTIQISLSWALLPVPRLRKVSFTANVTEKADLVLAAQASGACSLAFDTPKIPLATVTAGPIPVPITIALGGHLQLDASGMVAATAGAHQTASLTAGIGYDDGRVTTIGTGETGFTIDPPQISVFDAKATLRAGPVVSVKVAGLAGADLGVDGVLGLDVTPLADPQWTLTGGLELRGGLSFLNFHKDVSLYQYTLPFAIASARGGGQAGSPPEAPLYQVRGAGDVFARPDLSAPPLDSLPEGTPLALTCATKGPIVSGPVGISDTWYGMSDGRFINSVYVAVSDITADFPQCPTAGPAPEPLPPPPLGQPAAEGGPQPPPPVHPRRVSTPTPPPLPVATLDQDNDGVLDADDRCPATPGVAPHGCPRQRGIARTPNGAGYWLTAEDGGVFTFGNGGFYGSEGGVALAAPVVGIAATPSGDGYWLVGADGGVFAFGDAPFLGSRGGQPLNAPIVGIAGTPSGKGYWLVGADGGVFTFGDAGFFGSMGSTPLAKPVVAIVPTPTGRGYWLIAADGGVFAFGDAPFLGSYANQPLSAPIVGGAGTPTGAGYWLVGADGGVITFGDARFFGSLGNTALNQPIVGIAPAADGLGYWLLGGDGGVFAFGSAPFLGAIATR